MAYAMTRTFVPLEAKRLRRELWRYLHRVARSGEPATRRQFLEAVRQLRAGIDLSALESALEAGNVDAAMRAIPWDVFEGEFARVEAMFGRLFERGAQAAAAELSGRLGMTLAFDLVNERSVVWAEEHAAQLVREISTETQQAVRQIIVRGFVEGETAVEMRQAIYGRVGLTRRQQMAVANYRVRMEVEEGLTGARLDRTVSRYVERTIRRRAENIARTETIRAAHAGTQEIWREAVGLGYIEADARRQWIVTPDDRLCNICEPMHGQVVGLEEDFASPKDGATTLYPPLHPSCRCSVALVI